MLETPPALLMFGCVHKPMYALPRVRYRCQWQDDRLNRDVGITSVFEYSPSGASISLGNKHTTIAQKPHPSTTTTNNPKNMIQFLNKHSRCINKNKKSNLVQCALNQTESFE